MKFLTGLSCLAAVASAVVVDLNKRDSPLDVKIESTGNTAIKASITNTGASDLKVLKAGSILDKLAVEKAEVFAGSDKVEFDGIRLRLGTNGLPEDAFQVISAGETVSVEWNYGEVHDLSVGGKVDVAAKGALSIAEVGSNDITSTASFSSNVLSVEVDGAAASKVRRDFRENVKRTVVQSDCTGTQRTATTTALSNCRALAAAASSAASTGAAAKMVEYFKSSSTATRTTVAGVFAKVATECGSTTSGVSKQYCTDIYPACSSGVIAYTLPSASYMVNCPYFFNSLTALSSTCHAQDRATTALHEVTHLTQIKGTTDQSSCYGYSCVQSLTAAQNLNHADTYALFANAIYVGC
ncbi:metalloproteinase [Colletotrichum fioriniae PJ7]|uniref:Neutral protease 2 n=1 Tax=Colletotrichum fioriniae PJ7 TaxID=1445577 RepID=A0A010S3Z0_9PEZI|nr:metalloproteinase [Colletotrichum fioriniae PJ7]